MRFHRCRNCGHKNRLFRSDCSVCGVPTPFWNHESFYWLIGLGVFGGLLTLL